ncbi:MAG: hypothetical protein H7296_05450 [Bacteroidia bacterium]|nr:hypothetical protein [Bacteroidia bacterium]
MKPVLYGFISSGKEALLSMALCEGYTSLTVALCEGYTSQINLMCFNSWPCTMDIGIAFDLICKN